MFITEARRKDGTAKIARNWQRIQIENQTSAAKAACLEYFNAGLKACSTPWNIAFWFAIRPKGLLHPVEYSVLVLQSGLKACSTPWNIAFWFCNQA